jgi:hypothetical protein
VARLAGPVVLCVVVFAYFALDARFAYSVVALTAGCILCILCSYEHDLDLSLTTYEQMVCLVSALSASIVSPSLTACFVALM